MDKITLKAQERNITGRKVKRLRKEGKLPGNVYGSDIKSVAVTLDAKEFLSAYKKSGETSVVELVVGKQTYPVLIHNIQIDPVTSSPLHADFLKIDLKKKVTANIPLELVGEAPAEKQGVGTVVSYVDEVEVEALPGDLIDKIEVNVEALTEAEQSISIKDLHYDKEKLTITNDPETIVVKVEVQKEEPVQAPPAPAEGEEVPVEGGEAPAEGAATSSEETSQEEKKE
jgi:large subunit ribosomal protein L25